MSRGASHAVFVDSNSGATGIVRENLQTTGFTAGSVVLCRRGEDFLLTCKEEFDVVFLDPPYGLNCIPDIFPLLLPHLSDYAVVVCEHAAATPLPEEFGPLLYTEKGDRNCIVSPLFVPVALTLLPVVI